MRKTALFFILISLCISVFSDAKFERHLHNSKIYYGNGEFDKVIDELNEALNIAKKVNQHGMIEAYKYLAFSYVAYDEFDKAAEFFIEILKLDPSFDLDRTMTSPKIYSVFEKAKAQLKHTPAKEKKKEPEQVMPKEVAKQPEPVTEVPQEKPVPRGEITTSEFKIVKKERSRGPMPSRFSAIWRSTLFPGWGQLHKGEKAKGWIMIGSSTLLTLVRLGAISEVKKAEEEYYEETKVSSQKEEEAWIRYEGAFKKYRLISLVQLVFFTYNMVDVSFLGWRNYSLSFEMNPQQSMFKLEYRF